MLASSTSNVTADDSGAQPGDDDPVTDLAEDFQTKAPIEDVDLDWGHFYKQEMEDPTKRKTWFVSHCVLKETARVTYMLQEYKGGQAV